MKNKIAIAALVLAGIGLGAAAVLFMQPSAKAGPDCSGPNPGSESYNVMIMDGKAEPANVAAKLCDTLTIMNMDDVTREIAFGPHERHVPYDGIAAKLLNEGQSLTVTLNQPGSFRYHDHMHDEVQGYFTVTK